MTPIEQAITQAIAAGYEPKLERFAEIEGAEDGLAERNTLCPPKRRNGDSLLRSTGSV
jgi:hypothetical protein